MIRKFINKSIRSILRYILSERIRAIGEDIEYYCDVDRMSVLTSFEQSEMTALISKCQSERMRLIHTMKSIETRVWI